MNKILRAQADACAREEDKQSTAENRWAEYQSIVQAWNILHPENQVTDSVYINTSENSEEVGSWVSTISYSDGNSTYEFSVNPTGNQISFSLANAIKYYNGGYYCVLVNSAGERPYWRVNKLNQLASPFDYLGRICTGTGWINF